MFPPQTLIHSASATSGPSAPQPHPVVHGRHLSLHMDKIDSLLLLQLHNKNNSANDRLDMRRYGEKLEASRLKLAAGYERERLIKRQHTICILEPHQVPAPHELQVPARPAAHSIPDHGRVKAQRKLGSSCSSKGRIISKCTGHSKRWKSSQSCNVIRKMAPESCYQTPSKPQQQQQLIKQKAILDATQRRNELLRNLGHDDEQLITHAQYYRRIPAPSPPQRPAAPMKSYHDTTNTAAGADTSVISSEHGTKHLQNKSSMDNVLNIADIDHDIKRCAAPVQIIRKSMFKFTIKLGTATASATAAAH